MPDVWTMRSALEAVYDDKLCISEVVEELPGWGFTFEEMLNDLLMYAYMWVGSPLIDKDEVPVLETLRGRKALQILGKLAEDKGRAHMVSNYFLKNVYEGNYDWLRSLTPHFPLSLYSILLWEKCEEGQYYEDARGTRNILIQNASKPMREAIAHEAAKQDLTMTLYEMTGWSECQKYAKGETRDKMMAHDLGL